MLDRDRAERLLTAGHARRRVGAVLPGAGLRFPAGPAGGGGLPEVLQLLARFKRRLCLGALLGLCAGLVLLLILPARYQARVGLEIQNPNADFLNARAVTSVAEASAADSGSLTDVATELKVIESDQLLDRTINSLQAAGQAGPLKTGAAHRSLLGSLLHRKPLTQEMLAYRMREQARANLTAKQVGPTRVVELLYSATDPAFAASFVNTLAQQYIDMSEESRSSKSRRTEESLSHELDEVRGRLRASQDALQRYATGSGLLFVNGQRAATDAADISEQKLQELETALSQAENERVQAQAHEEMARSADPAAVGDVLNDPSLRQLSEKLTDLKREQADLTTIYTEQNDRVRRVASQIAPLEAEFRTQRSSILNRIAEDYATAQRKERLLKAAYNAQVQVVENREGAGVQYNILRQDVDSNQKLYESVLEEVRRAGIASTVRSNNIEIFDPARPPVTPYFPRPALLCAISILGGLLAAALFTLFTESSDRRLMGMGELPAHLPIRELGAIPSNASGRVLGIPAKKERKGIELVTWSKPKSLVDDAYRALLTSILYSDEDGAPPRTIVLTSANPGEGKTATASNLAILMAELKLRVLLIDADLRRPRLHEVFGVSADHGLHEFLREKEPRDVHRVAQATFVPNLSLIPCGLSEANPSRLLHSERLAAVLEQLRQSYDVILIDTSPSLLTADARILGRNADAVILVTRVGFTTYTQVEMLAEVFAADGTRLLGTVVNDVKASRTNYSYYAVTA